MLYRLVRTGLFVFIFFSAFLFVFLPNLPLHRVQAQTGQTFSTGAQFQKKGRYRSTKCWRLARDIRESVRSQYWLLRRFQRFACDVAVWKRCQARSFSSKKCRNRKQKLKWGACFRIHRRLFVVTHRLSAWNKEGQKARCRWKLRIPERFEQVLFAPFPRFSKER